MSVYQLDQAVAAHTDPSFDAKWRDLTAAGAAACSKKNHETAMSFYEAALQEASELLEASRQCACSPVSALRLLEAGGNLAALLTMMDQRIEAMVVIRDVVKSYLDVIEDGRSCVNLRKTCCQNLNTSLRALQHYSERAGAPQRSMQRIMRRARLAPTTLVTQFETLQ